MNRWHIAAILVAALLLVGGAGAVKPEKGPVDKVVFVQHKDPSSKNIQSVGSPGTFKLWGPRWNAGSFPVTYTVHSVIPITSANPSPPGAPAVAAELQKAFAAWDDPVTSQVLFVPGTAEDSTPGDNLKNDVYFAPIDDPGIIAVTTVWYYQYSREIVQADIMMNTNMRWGIDTDGEGAAPLVGAFDIRNIATHEVGHVCGLADLYKTVSRDLTMYGYGSEGEVKKISLTDGDIAGVRYLYGA